MFDLDVAAYALKNNRKFILKQKYIKRPGFQRTK